MAMLRGHFGNGKCAFFKMLQNLVFMPHVSPRKPKAWNSCIATGKPLNCNGRRMEVCKQGKTHREGRHRWKPFIKILVGQASVWQLEFMGTLAELISQGLADLGNIPEVIFSLKWTISGHFSNVLYTNLFSFFFFLTLERAQLLISVLYWMETIYSYCCQGHLNSCPLAEIHIFPAKCFTKWILLYSP